MASPADEVAAQHMRTACALAWLSNAVDSAYCVGCVVYDPSTNAVLATGYSRELPGNTHAEECALRKLEEKPVSQNDGLIEAHMYTTMEPCSERLSGNIPCCQSIIKTLNSHNNVRIKRVYVGALEPANFVDCKGVQILQDSGIDVRLVCDTSQQQDRLIWECLAPNHHILGKSGPQTHRIRPYRLRDKAMALQIASNNAARDAIRSIVADTDSQQLPITGLYVAETVLSAETKTQAADEAMGSIEGILLASENPQGAIYIEGSAAVSEKVRELLKDHLIERCKVHERALDERPYNGLNR